MISLRSFGFLAPKHFKSSRDIDPSGTNSPATGVSIYQAQIFRQQGY
jgi:hypothetical protein